MAETLSVIIRQVSQQVKQLVRSSRIPIMAGMALLTATILGWLVYRQRELLFSFQWEFRPIPILLSFVFYSLSLFTVALVWSRVMNALGGKASFRKHFRLFCISNLAKRLPGTVWYIPWRIRMYQELGVSLGLVSVASGIELAVSAISGAMVCLIFAIPLLTRYSYGIWVSILLVVLGLGLLHPRVIRAVSRLLKVELSQVRYGQILSWICLFFLSWVITGILFFFVVNIFSPVPISQLGFVIGAWTFTGVLSMTLLLLPSNFGFTEISLSLLLSLIMPSPIAVVTAVGTRVLILLYELLWASSMIGLEYCERRKITP